MSTYDLPDELAGRRRRPDPGHHAEPARAAERHQPRAPPRAGGAVPAARRRRRGAGGGPHRHRAGLLGRRRLHLPRRAVAATPSSGTQTLTHGRQIVTGMVRLPRADRRRRERTGGRARLQPGRALRHRLHGRERAPGRPARAASASWPPTAGPVIWPLLTSLQLAKEYALTGDRIPAERAAEIGLVNHVCPDDEVLDQAMACAHRIARLPKGAVEDTKRILNIQLERAVLADARLRAERRGPVVHLARAPGQPRPAAQAPDEGATPSAGRRQARRAFRPGRAPSLGQPARPAPRRP